MMEFKFEQPKKQLSSRDLTKAVSLNVTDPTLVQLAKQPFPRDVTELGIIIEIRAMQPLKQYSPRDITESGIVMEANLLQFWKQPFLRDVTKWVSLNVT